jgi:hypothetical protein
MREGSTIADKLEDRETSGMEGGRAKARRGLST